MQRKERTTVSNMRVRGVRTLLQRDTAGIKRLRRTPRINQRLGQVLVNGQRSLTQGCDVHVERNLVPVYAGLIPGQFSEDRENSDEEMPRLLKNLAACSQRAVTPPTRTATPMPAVRVALSDIM